MTFTQLSKNRAPKHLKPRREKIFGLAGGIPHDRNARIRIETYVKAWNAKHKQEGQHQGPITAAYQRVLHVLLWHFMSYKDGRCFPSYEAIAGKARCCRVTVYAAIQVLEETGALTWAHRIDRVSERVKDLFGHWKREYRIVRRSNVYRFRDPLPCSLPPETRSNSSGQACKFKNHTGAIQETDSSSFDPAQPLENALIRLNSVMGG